MTAVQVHYEGRVQGVGFRYAVKTIATGFEVCGCVRNLPDGRVELMVRAAEADELNAFLREIRESDLGGLIRLETPQPVDPATIPSRGFEITH